MSTSFSTIPIVDLSRLQNPETTDSELVVLRDAIFHVGFLYLVNTGLESLIKEAHARMPEVFSIPVPEKDAVDMINSPAFLGYTSLGRETTASVTDLREQFDFGSEVEDFKEGDPFWQRLEGPSQFPNESIKDLVRRYMAAMEALGRTFVRFAAKSISLPADTFEPFLGKMSRLKFVKYPESPAGSQGVGPHKDSIGLFTYLAQDNVGGLQVLNKSGEWIDAPPIEGSLVINIAQGFEAITGGVCSGTTHRVMSPTSCTRYSIPYFQAVRLDLRLDDLKRSTASIVDRIPASDDKKKRAVDVPSELISPQYACFGEAQLRNRIFSHPDVGKKWYPELYSRYSQQSVV
ncbi:hypothetical protein C8Q69DRAFT_469807 [Paecilomyces variotii]|uniref:Fe2OG dioxygenase domain-containing protein n=1 Tax=Byssochlamys spectabilis TaxID=264951 RepID=A0A443HR84_BYSSP|nr:hypothetical protein C8Q69DRAFT_469807 [Paecilomyces variotii]KAJ9365703.1 hypothetical protein DTO280E4_672 [Paecilomyces variotii]RWQ94326.1 hypothetical protein C8Q69DRAFT_469807 [Paecilomyces variotii]